MAPLATDILKNMGIEIDVITGMSPDELKACIGKYDGLAIRSSSNITADIIAAEANDPAGNVLLETVAPVENIQ
jgi:D-3-phosphoglycerate dehydrogenase